MDTILALFKQEHPHHFYLVEGMSKDSSSDFFERIKEIEDAHLWSYDTLGVEEAKQIREKHSERSWKGGRQVFVVFALSVTHEAQQSLLKMFEEPKSETHFVLIVPDATSILPTVKSRAQYVRFNDSSNEYGKAAQDFIASPKEKRIAYVAELIKSHEDDEASGGLRLAASQFIVALVQELLKQEANLIEKKAFLKDALTMREYLDARGASVKMILEHFALTL